MDNFLSCTLCMSKFDTLSHLPLILLCGHTFCSSCISTLISHIKITKASSFLPCPLDKSMGSQTIDISLIPVNKVIIDMIDFSGHSFSTLTLKDNNDDAFSNFSYLNSYSEKLEEGLKKSTNEYDIIYSAINNMNGQKDKIIKGLEEVYDFIIEKIVNEKKNALDNFRKFMEKKIKEMLEVNKIVERNKNISNIGIKKIKMLKEQKMKKITISDQLMLLNELNIETIENKADNQKIEKIIWEIVNDKNTPKINIKNDVLVKLDQLIRSVIILYPDNINEEFTNSMINNEIDISNNGENHICNISELNFTFSSLKINPDFIWFQPNSNCIYKYDTNNKWIPIPNKSNHIFSEMFRVCQISNFSYLLTGGVINLQSSNETYYYHTSNEITKRQNMITPRRAHGTVFFKDHVYACGGISTQCESIPYCEKYIVDKDSWVPISDLPSPRSHVTLCSVNNKKIFSFGGDTNENVTNLIDIYEDDNDIWTQLSITLPYFVECPSVCQVDKNKILVCGGYSPGRGTIPDVLEFDTETFQINTNLDPIQTAGWSIYHSFFHMGMIHMFFGGESSTPPLYCTYQIKKI